MRAEPCAPRLVADQVWRHVGGRVRRAADDVRTSVHETVANAVLHGGGPITVVVVDAGRWWQVTVTDPGRARPAATPRPHGEHGRGTALVAASCDAVRRRWPAAGGCEVRLRFLAGDRLSPRCSP